MSKERKAVQAEYFVDQCRLGRGAETCRSCMRQSRWAKRAAARYLRRASRQDLQVSAR